MTGGICLRKTVKERIEGLEPSAFAMATRRSSQLSYIRLLELMYCLIIG